MPLVLTLTFLSFFMSYRAWENLGLLAVLVVLGYGLKKYNWSRSPLVIGLILGRIMEDSFHKAMSV